MIRAFILLIGCIAIPSSVIAKKKDQPLYTFQFEGSIQDAGDYFTWTAEIYEDRIKSNWSGLLGNAFIPTENPKRLTKRFTIKRASLVKAMIAMGESIELCDPGGHIALGQGLSVELKWKRHGDGKKGQMLYFAVPEDLWFAHNMASLPLAFIDYAVDNDVREFEALASNLAQRMQAYHTGVNALKGAYKSGTESIEPFLALHRPKDPAKNPKRQRLAKEAQAVLTACFSKEKIPTLLGGRSKKPFTSILVAIDEVNRARGSFGENEHDANPAHVLPKSPAVPVVLLPKNARRQLLHFTAGKRLIGGHLIHDFFELELRARAEFNLIFNPSFISFKRVDDEPVEGVNDRVAFLNRQGLLKGLFGSDDPGERPYYLRIKRVLIENDDWQRAKITYLLGEDKFVLPVEKIGGRWQVGERWEERAYHDEEDVIRNSDFFRPRGAKPRR